MFGKIIEMSPFLTDNRFPELAEIDAYWTALRGARPMPKRQELDPRGIEGALPNSFLLQRIAPGPTRIRLAGSQLAEILGTEIRGMAIQSLFTPYYQSIIEKSAEEVCSRPAIAQFWLSGERGNGKPAMEARMTLWPLADDQGRATQILGALSCKGRAGAAPRRFHIASYRLLEIDAATHKPRLTFAEDAQLYDDSPAPSVRNRAAGVPYLWLVKNE